jgi:phosphate starvation-inducible protein PhoH and related proteins
VNSQAGTARPTSKQDIDLAPQQVERLFSGLESPIHEIERAAGPFQLQITQRPGGAHVTGDAVGIAVGAAALRHLSQALSTAAFDLGVEAIRGEIAAAIENELKHDLAFRLVGLPHAVRPMSLSQVAFMNTLLHASRPLIFGVGPAGTGKTYLAVAAGLSLVAEQRFKCLIITRPRVLLEGEIMTPALRAETTYDEQLTPIEDVLHDLIGPDELKQQVAHGLIQIMPLGRMRGRTFNESYVLIDEAQNMTVRKMRMALTRLGRDTRMVVTGDPRQVDLNGDEPSGLIHILRLISGTDLALIHRFQNQEIIRNDVVAQIEALYAREDTPETRAAA